MSCSASKAASGSGPKPSRPRASTNSTSSPSSPVIRYRASLPPLPCRLPFAIIAHRCVNGGKRDGEFTRQIENGLRQLIDLHLEAARALFANDEHQLVQRAGDLV